MNAHNEQHNSASPLVKQNLTTQPAAAQEVGYIEFLDAQNHSLRRAIHAIMKKLAFLLDEDQFADIDSIALAAGAAPVTAAPAVDVETLRALSDRWANDRSYTGSPVDDIRALIEQPTKTTPAAPGIDLTVPDYIKQAHDKCKLWPESNWPGFEPDAGFIALLEIRNWVETLIDASPKGGSEATGELRIWGVQKPGIMPKLCGAREIAELNWYPSEGYDLICLQVVERVPARVEIDAIRAQAQAGDAEVQP